MNNKDIIITGLQSWDIKIGSNCKNIALEFSRKNRVLYVNPPIDRFTAYRNPKLKKHYKYAGGKNNLVKINKNLWVLYPQHIIESISRLPVNYLFDRLNKHNNYVFAKDIMKGIKFLGMKDYIHFCDSDVFRSFYLKDILQPKIYIYYSRDNLMAVKYWQTQGKRIEPLHMSKADIVLTNSTYLAEKASSFNLNSFFVGQGCDLTAFRIHREFTIPEEIKTFKTGQPVIGYIGALKTLRLDIETIKYIASNRPQWKIVLVGPEDKDFKNSILHKMSNVVFTGSKPESELPGYLKTFTVAINPQQLNEVTFGNYPRKIDEYLVMGKPVVATKTPAMEYFRDYVSLANSKESWILSIEKELNSNNSQKEYDRIQFASKHTWENNVNEIYNRVQMLENKMQL